MLTLEYPPHVTLAVYDRLRVDTATPALDPVFDDLAQMAVTLTHVTTFGIGSGVLYAALEPSPDLMRLHARAAAAIDEVCRPHYRTGSWTPHCTLATGVHDADMDRARAILERDWRSRTGVFEMAALVEFMPVTGIEDWTLAPRPHSTHSP
jgi:2'-5' RNA ligase